MNCVQSVKLDFSICILPCSGLVLTSFAKQENSKNVEKSLQAEFHLYKIYKKHLPFPPALSGSIVSKKVTMPDKVVHLNLSEYEWKNKLRYVRIYFDTPTFDRITKDRAAKPVDMLSSIGGTMGLLTGFSIISGVEIVYFSVKFIVTLLRK